jgi:tetratricopeptide (TPR) repeat protein
MNRTVKHGIQFTFMIIFGLSGVIALGITLAYLFPQSTGALLILGGLALFLPGRILNHYWKDYFEGQKLQARGKHLEALIRFERFLRALRARPVLKRLIWLTEWIYTRSAEVMALTNMGVCYVRLKNLEEAEKHLDQAAQLDPLSPLPHFNLSVVHHARGNEEQAAEHMAKATELGYRRSSIKRLAQAVKDAQVAEQLSADAKTLKPAHHT